jgi:hypothetical protein
VRDHAGIGRRDHAHRQSDGQHNSQKARHCPCHCARFRMSWLGCLIPPRGVPV